MNPQSRNDAGARPSAGRLASAAVLIALAAGAAAGCRAPARQEGVPVMPERPIAEVLAAHTPELMSWPGVVGTAQGARSDGSPIVIVMIERHDAALERRIPRTLEGWPVRVEVTGPLRAMPESTP